MSSLSFVSRRKNALVLLLGLSKPVAKTFTLIKNKKTMEE